MTSHLAPVFFIMSSIGRLFILRPISPRLCILRPLVPCPVKPHIFISSRRSHRPFMPSPFYPAFSVPSVISRRLVPRPICLMTSPPPDTPPPIRLANCTCIIPLTTLILSSHCLPPFPPCPILPSTIRAPSDSSVPLRRSPNNYFPVFAPTPFMCRRTGAPLLLHPVFPPRLSPCTPFV